MLTLNELEKLYEDELEHWCDTLEPQNLAKLHGDINNSVADYGMKMQCEGFCHGYLAALRNDSRLKKSDASFDYAAELCGISATLRSIMCLLSADACSVDMPSNQVLYDSLYAQASLIERISDDITSLR